MLAPSAPALAQDTSVRDPFAPLVSPTEASGGTTDPGVPDPADPVVVPDPTEPLPGTGSETTSWVGLGYVLIALGAGAVTLSKVYGPLRVTAR